MSLRLILLSLGILLFPSISAAFDGYVQAFESNGTITWGNGAITVKREVAQPPLGEDEAVVVDVLATRKAVSSARKQMLDMILSTRIDAKQTIRSYLAQEPDLAAEVRGVVQNSPLERPAVFDGVGEVVVSEVFRGRLADLVLPTTIPFQSGIPPKFSTTSLDSEAEENELPEEAGAGAGLFTGLIIDASHLQMTPSLTPVVYGQDGVGVYGAFQVSRAAAIEKGVVAYATTSDPLALQSRVGKNPLLIPALKAFGSWRTDVVIPAPMARLARAILQSHDIVANCRVVIVLPEPEFTDAVEKSFESEDLQ